MAFGRRGEGSTAKASFLAGKKGGVRKKKKDIELFLIPLTAETIKKKKKNGVGGKRGKRRGKFRHVCDDGLRRRRLGEKKKKGGGTVFFTFPQSLSTEVEQRKGAGLVLLIRSAEKGKGITESFFMPSSLPEEGKDQLELGGGVFFFLRGEARFRTDMVLLREGRNLWPKLAQPGS